MEPNQLVGLFLVVLSLLDALAGLVLRGRSPSLGRVFPFWIASSLVIAGIGIGLLVT